MEHFIDPTTDCVFKALLGVPGKEAQMANFLNNILQPKSPITDVTYLSPFNERTSEDDKLSIVDIKVQDANGNFYQVEVQVITPAFLLERMLHNWATIYRDQIGQGDAFSLLKPVISIWLLTGKLNKQNDIAIHHYGLWDPENLDQMIDHLSIYIIELGKWRPSPQLQASEFWLYFFKEAKGWKALPSQLTVDSAMREAMNDLENFSDQSEAYAFYRLREEKRRILLTEQQEREKLERSEAEATKALAKATAAQEQAELEKRLIESEKQQIESEKKQLEERVRQLEAQLQNQPSKSK